MYEQFYGLAERPFQLTPDPAYYFESLTHKKALSYLGYGLNQGEGFIVITGEVGAGKSTLVAHLKRKLDNQRVTVGEVVTSALDSQEMVQLVASSFGLETAGADKADTLGMIEAFLHEEAREGRRVLLVVDEAQNLSIGAIEELRMLSNFQLGAHPLLQTLLLGQPEFKRLLANSEELEQLRQRVIAAHHLEPMQLDEIEHYVTHRLAHAGWNGTPGFDPELWAPLHAASGGIPRRIHHIMNRLMLLGSIEEQDVLNPAMLATVVEEIERDTVETSASSETRPKPDRDLPAGDAIAKVRSEADAGADTAPSGSLSESQLSRLREEFSKRDAQIEGLREELDALIRQRGYANVGEGSNGQFERLEARLDEQERSLRQVLTMMIAYFENADDREAA